MSTIQIKGRVSGGCGVLQNKF